MNGLTKGGGPVKICFPFPGDSVVGGSHVNAVDTANRLEERGHDCTMLVHQEGPLTEWFGRIGRDCEILPGRTPLPAKGLGLARNLGRASVNWLRIARWLRRSDVDVVIPTDGRGIIGWARPTRAAGRGLVYHHQTPGAGRMVRRSAGLADAVVTISRFNLASLPGSMRERSTVIPNAVGEPVVDRATARSELREPLGIGAGTVVVGFVGNFIERKRPLVFAEMVRLIGPGNLVSVMFGGPMDERLHGEILARTIGLRANGSLILGGFVPDLRNKIAGLDVLVAPQVDEGFGLNVAEAMAAGVPVVAANSGAHPELITHGSTGLLAEPDDPAGFAGLVERLIEDDRLREGIGEAGRRHILDNHSVHAFGDRFDKVIRGLGGRRR